MCLSSKIRGNFFFLPLQVAAQDADRNPDNTRPLKVVISSDRGSIARKVAKLPPKYVVKKATEQTATDLVIPMGKKFGIINASMAIVFQPNPVKKVKEQSSQ